MKRRLIACIAMVLVTVFLVASTSVVMAPAPSQPTVSASIVNTGPIVKVDQTLTIYIFVKNGYPLVNSVGTGLARDKIINAFVVTQITSTTVAPDGSVTSSVTTPDGQPYPHQVNRWPQTVYNNAGTVELKSPSILPGENTVLFTIGWIHPADEMLGKYTLTFTIDGTINGTSLTISTQTIVIDK